ncbi:MAG: toll/interleukin-1 receptor domain-containing protein [Erysipelotrichaceae bacterium]|nr:toll/interleukin-1 receptor domain-containing protein [Erysipelotrichaceae bacterium]
MITHYNAFISYRHTERDIAVASEVQRQLEHFRIPEAIQKSSGIKKIERIFRDKDELPLSSNLSNDIETALTQSDYLIVICSPHIAESRWVQREIELFLETHDQDHVLTVISEGEPENVLPERLTYRIETYTDENGIEQEERIPLEPLSCDYRMPFNKAKKLELPRLAAVILGCSYDELVQRARQYRQKRLLAISAFAGVLSFAAIAWLVWSNIRISENLKQAQINESQYLSFGSLEALNDQDRILAIQLALEALPKEGNERPVIAQAESALAQAIGSYLTTNQNARYFAVDKYSSETVIRDFWMDSSKTVLVTFDMDSRLTYFDMISGQIINTVPLHEYMNVLQNPDNDLLAYHDQDVFLYDQKNGEVLYEAVLPARIGNVACYSGGCIFNTGSAIYDIDNNGNIIGTYSQPQEYAYCMQVSDDGSRILRSVSNEDGSYSVILTEGDSRTVLPESFIYPVELLFAENGNIIVADYDTSSESYASDNFKYYHPMKWYITCWSEDGQEKLWSHEFSNILSSATDLHLSSYSDEDGNHECLICSTGSMQAYIDTGSGEIFKQFEYPASVLGILSEADNNYLTLLSNGGIAITALEDDYYSILPAFSQKTADGKLFSNSQQAGALIRTSGSNSIIRYDLNLNNPNYTEFVTIPEHTIQDLKVFDHYFAASAYKTGLADTDVYIYDRNDSSHCQILSFPDGNITANMFGITSDSQTAWTLATDYNRAVLRRMTLSDENTEDIELFSGLKLSHLVADAKGDLVCSIAVNNEEQMLYCSTYDVVENKETVISRPMDEDFSIKKITVRDDGRWCLAELDTHSLCLIDASDLSMIRLNEEDAPDEYKPVFADKKIAFRTGDSIKVTDYSGQTILNLPQDMMNVLSFTFLNDQLAVLTSNSVLNIYDDLGNTVKTYSVPVPAGKSYYYFDEYRWNLYSNTLSLHFNNTMFIIDLAQDSPRVTANLGRVYDHNTQEIIVRSYFGDSIGIFHVCTAEELIEQGREIVKDTEIPEEIRNKYGLDN